MKESRHHIAIFSATTRKLGRSLAACLTGMFLLLSAISAQAQNVPPSADIDGPDLVEEGAPSTWDGSGSDDPDGEIVRYDWSVGNEFFFDDAGPTFTYTFPIPSGSPKQVQLIVTDDDGEIGIAQLNVTVVDPGGLNEPPVPDAGGDYTGEVGIPVEFDGSKSYDLDGEIVEWCWSFGDVTDIVCGRNVTHIYASKSPPNPGYYAASLQVTDNSGDTATDFFEVDIVEETSGNKPPIAEANGPYYVADVADPVTFDGRDSDDPDGDIIAWVWDFGDDTGSSGETTNHIYDEPGLYHVTLTVTDDDNISVSDLTTAIVASPIPPPLAEAGGPYAGLPGDSIIFDGSDSSSGYRDIIAHIWDFGDGKFAFGERTSHVYDSEGQYDVVLTIYDDAGKMDEDATVATISEGPQPELPVADAGGEYSGVPREPITFDASGSTCPGGCDATTYSWDFGDGTDGVAGITVPHTYSSNGVYQVTLTILDEGLTDTDKTTATIADGNVPPVAVPGGPYFAEVGEDITFDGSDSYDEDGIITSWIWEYGNGGSDSGETVTDFYSEEKIYNVTLTVMDDNGAVDSAGTYAVIGGPPPFTPQLPTTLAIPDVDGSTDPEAALVAVNDGRMTAPVMDVGSGALLNTVTFPVSRVPIDARLGADLNSDGNGDIYGLFWDPSESRPVVEARDPVTGEKQRRIFYNKDHAPLALGIGGSQSEDVLVLARQTANQDAGRLLIKNFVTAATRKNISLPKNFWVEDLVMAPDSNGNGFDEALVKATRITDGRGMVLVYDTEGPKINFLQVPNGQRIIDYDDVLGPGAVPAVAVLALRTSDQQSRLHMYDLTVDDRLWRADLSSDFTPVAVRSFKTAGGANRLAVLLNRVSDQKPTVWIYNANNGDDLIRKVQFDVGQTGVALTIFPDTSLDAGTEPELGVTMDDGTVEIRDSKSKALLQRLIP